METTVIQLTPDAHGQASVLSFLMAYTATLHQNNTTALNTLIQEDTGIDISEGGWNLDVDTGILTRNEQPATEPDELHGDTSDRS